MNEKMIERVLEIVRSHGGKPTGSASRINQYFPSPWPGEYFVTDESNSLIEYRSELGSYNPIGGGLNVYTGDYWDELVEEFGLICVSDEDAANAMTYPGHRRKYWKIDKGAVIDSPPFAGEQTASKNLSVLTTLVDEDWIG